MNSSSLDYFNGKSARSFKVIVTLVDNHVQIFEHTESTILIASSSLRDCSISYLNKVMFFYLDVSKTSYVVIPSDHELFETIKNKINSFSHGWFNKLMSVRGVPLIGLFIGLVLLVYSLFISVVPWFGLKLISIPKEIELGNNFYHSYMKEVQEDTLSSNYAQEFANNIHLSSTYPIKVTVVRDSLVNAFAMPGGHIIVYSGIVKNIHSSKEFAALLAHESTHINDRHGMKSLLRSVSSSLLFSIILNDIGNASGVLVRNADQLRTFSFSRSLEEEADAKGMGLMIKNNIDPVGMKLLMQDLQKANKDLPEAFSFISTHPLTTERIRSADRYLHSHLFTIIANPTGNDLWEKLSNR